MEHSKKIVDLNGVLNYQVQLLYKAEKQLQKGLTTCLDNVTSANLSQEIWGYVQKTEDKVLKLERVFNYLLQEPSNKPNAVIDSIIEETQDVRRLAPAGAILDALLIACLRRLISYKVAGYRNAHIFALEVEMEVVSGLLYEILKWEELAEESLAKLAVNEINVP